MNKETKEILNLGKDIIKNKKFQIGLTVILFLIILISSTMIRTGNISLLKDVTTGKYIPADPDACYELRVAQTLLDRGNINGIDAMRNPGLNVTYASEMLPKMLAFSYKTMHSFGSAITLDKIDVMYPVVAFAIGLIIFFALCWYLSGSEIAAIIASALLAYSPSYLSRTTGGVSSHEALGMPFMFLAMLIFAVSLSRVGKNWKQVIIGGIGSGVCLALSYFSWSGASNFVFMMLPIASILFYLFGVEDNDLDKKIKFISFTALWIISSIIVMPLFGYHFSDMYSKFLSSYGVAIPFIVLFAAIDTFILKYKEKVKFAKNKYRIFYSIIISVFVGLIGLIATGRNPVAMLKAIYIQLLFPMGLARVNLTVAYYAQPYISDLIAQYTPVIFWLFVLGMVFMGIETSKSISSTRHKIGFVLAWAIAVLGMMFSRTSASSVFNGSDFISQAVYLLSFLIFAGYFLWLYINDKFKIEPASIFLFAWMFVMLLSTRSAVRVIFVIYTFVAFAVAYASAKLYEQAKKIKDSTGKAILYLAAIISILFILISLFGNPVTHSYGSYQVSKYSAANMGPIANDQWQNGMTWVRNNTPVDAVFAHWWDYGYQIQTMANRTTVLDGGNYNVYWDYMMGRYVLTTPKPITALSFMKSHNATYLLIDPTDLGKYAAYSKIGSDLNWDRFSSPQTMVVDEKQSKETSTGNAFVYTGGSFVDGDIEYNGSFIPGPSYDQNGIASYNAYIAGLILNVETTNKTGLQITQPTAVFIYNNKRFDIPIRYVYFGEKLMDFRSGINATFRIMPQVTQSTTGQISINQLGAGIYLSPRVSDSLFARLYLMNDPLNEYPSIKKGDFEDDYVVKALNQQNASLGEFIYFNGLRGPLKIWKVDTSGIKDYPEFREASGVYGSADSLFK